MVPCTLSYGPVTCVYLRMPYPCKMRERLWVDSVTGLKGDSKSFGFSVHLPLMFSILCARAHHDRKTIAVPQGLPMGSTNFCCESRQTKSSSQQKVLLVPSSGSCSSTAFSNSRRPSYSCRSTMSWASSPASVVKIDRPQSPLLVQPCVIAVLLCWLFSKARTALQL